MQLADQVQIIAAIKESDNVKVYITPYIDRYLTYFWFLLKPNLRTDKLKMKIDLSAQA